MRYAGKKTIEGYTVGQEAPSHDPARPTTATKSRRHLRESRHRHMNREVLTKPFLFNVFIKKIDEGIACDQVTEAQVRTLADAILDRLVHNASLSANITETRATFGITVGRWR